MTVHRSEKGTVFREMAVIRFETSQYVDSVEKIASKS